MAADLNLRLHWTIAIVVLICDIILTVATIVVNKTSDIPVPASGQTDPSAIIGWLSVFGSVFCFGCYGILIKTPSVAEANCDCMVFQCYYSVATAIISFVIWLAAGSSAGITFSGSSFLYGLLFGAIWIGSQVLGYNAIQILGYAVGPAIWVGTTIVTSFIWGAAVFHNPVHNMGGAIAAIGVLLLGVFFVTLSSIMNDRNAAKSSDDKLVAGDEAERSNSGGRVVFGFVCALLMGLANGSTMVPMNCFSNGCFGTDAFVGDEVSALAFLPSMSVGILVAQPVIFLLYWGKSMLSGVKPQFHFAKVALPAFLTGLFWGMGNFNAMFATIYLGQTVGFPLTQCCLIINGLWGILYYKEIQGALPIGLFALASVTLLAGAALDGLFV